MCQWASINCEAGHAPVEWVLKIVEEGDEEDEDSRERENEQNVEENVLSLREKLQDDDETREEAEEDVADRRKIMMFEVREEAYVLSNVVVMGQKQTCLPGGDRASEHV